MPQHYVNPLKLVANKLKTKKGFILNGENRENLKNYVNADHLLPLDCGVVLKENRLP